MACPNFVEKTFAGGSKTVKFMKVFSLESFLLYGILRSGNFFVEDNDVDNDRTEYHKRHFYVCDKFMRICQNRPLDKFI